MEILDDLVLHVGLGGGGEAQHRRNGIVAGPFSDEASHVAVVRAEVVSPPGEAVGLVQHPAADLPLVQDLPQGDAAQLLRGDQQDAGVAQADALQGVGPLRHGQQPVHGDAGTDAPGLQPRHLVGHQGHQGRDHYRERAGLVVAGQGGQLVAQGLAGAGGQDAQHVLSGHGRLDDGLLAGPSVLARRLGAGVTEAEPPGQLAAASPPL